MKKSKRTYITAVLILIAALFAWFTVLDFTRFFNNDYSYDIFPSAVLKRICVVLAAVIAWSVGEDGLSPADSRKMKAAFLFAFLGEAAFAVNERLIGVGLFGICHLFLIIRNSNNLRYRLEHANLKKKLVLMITIFLMVHLLRLFVQLFDVMDRPSIITLAVFSYAIILSISLWTGLACRILHLLPGINSKLACTGIVYFFCCDVLVGLDVALEVGMPWLLANSFIWIFYIPALTMLALSCYRYADDACY